MNGYERSWPTAVVAIGIGTLAGWAATGVLFETSAHDGEGHRDAVAVVTTEAGDAVESVRRERLDNPARSRRTLLAEYGTDDLLAALRAGERERDRRDAAVMLGAAPEPERVLGALMIALRTDPAAGVRAHAAEALGLLGHTGAAGMLGVAATSDRDAAVREAAAASLGSVGHGASVPLLITIAKTDASERVRAEAVRSLIRLGDRESIRGVESVMRTETSPLVRRAAVEGSRERAEGR